MSSENFHHFIQHKISQDIFTTNLTGDKILKIKSYRELIDSLDKWVTNEEEMVRI